MNGYMNGWMNAKMNELIYERISLIGGQYSQKYSRPLHKHVLGFCCHRVLNNFSDTNWI
jgi:hypothetical protein